MECLLPPPALPSRSDSVLLDNSTYFSARTAVTQGILDSRSVFNLASLLEAMVLKQRIFLAPTLNWKPDAPDKPLFDEAGPCHTLDLASMPRGSQSLFFLAALQTSLQDLQNDECRAALPHGDANVNDVRRILLDWLDVAKDDVDRFQQIYSAKVLLTDQASSTFLARLPSTESEVQSRERELAQYLLRTNVAFELSATAPYLPHSNRVKYIGEKLQLSSPGNVVPGIDLLRFVESNRNKIKREQTDSPGFRTDVPLVLAVALSGVKDPDEILGSALKLRNERAALRYREWSAKLVDALETDADERSVQTVAEGYRDAESLLERELKALYSFKKSMGVRVWGYVKSRLPSAFNWDSHEKFAQLVMQDMEYAATVATGSLMRRRLAILIKLAKETSTEDLSSLNDHLSRVFRRQYLLDPMELENLHFLRSGIG